MFIILFLASTIFIPACLAQGNETGYKKKWALVIGINSFDEGQLNRSTKLDLAARDFKKVLVSKAGFSDEGILELTDAAASKDAIIQASGNKWLGQLAGKEDLVVVFISTLCFPSTNGEVYLLPADLDLDNFYSTAIPFSEYLQNLKTRVGCKDLVVITQTIFSGAPQMVSGAKAEFGVYNVHTDESKLPKNMVLISSSKKDQPTWGTYFSDSLQAAVKAADKAKTLEDIFKFASEGTIRSTIEECKGCKIQTPVFYGSNATRSIKLLGAARDGSNTKPEAVRSFERVVEKLGQARAMLRYGKSQNALSLLETIGESSRLPMVDYLEGQVFAKRHEWSKAAQSFENAYKNSAQSIYCSQLANALIEANIKTEKPPEFYWHKAYKLDPKNIDAILGISESEGNERESINILTKALSDYPESAELHDRLSFAFKKKGSMNQALEHAHEAVILDSDSWTSFMNLGNLLMAAGNSNEAQAAFRQVLDLNPKSKEGYYMLARALEETKDPEGAVLALEQFVKLSSQEDKRLDQARRKIEELKKTISDN